MLEEQEGWKCASEIKDKWNNLANPPSQVAQMQYIFAQGSVVS
jgi:hypothetical protein